MRINQLKIKGFRGFKEEQTIILDNNIVLIYGLNGSGKSSFTEALEWLFFNEISRQRLSRCKSEYQYEEYLKNVFYTSPDNPYVELQGTIKGSPYVLRKEITTSGNKYFINKNEVDDFSSLSLNLEKYFRPMLAQTEIKALVDSEQKERWEQISSILGQDDLSNLRENLISLRNNKKDNEYKQILIKYSGLLKDVEETEELATLYENFKNLNIENLLTDVTTAFGVHSNSFEEFSTVVSTNIQKLFNTDLGKRITEITYQDSNKLQEYLENFKTIVENIEIETIKATYTTEDPEYIYFLSLGKKIANAPTCPYCLENTLTEKRTNNIDNLLEENKASQEANQSLLEQQRLEKQWMEIFRSALLLYLPNHKELRIVAQKFSDLKELDLAVKIQKLDTKIETLVEDRYKILADFEISFHKYLEKKYYHKEEAELSVVLEELLTDICTKVSDITNEWIDLKKEMAQIVSLEEKLDEKELRKWLLIEKIVKFITDNEYFIQKTKLLATIDNIQAKLEAYEKEEIINLIDSHGSEIKEYYSKLNPYDEVQFSGIEAYLGTRRQAKLKATAYGIDVNPVTFFSEAHTNSLALSIYFPQRVDRNTTWECVILDDPVQSMDENHSQALIDVLYELTSKKQLIVLTHSKEFYKRMTSRFSDKSSLNYHFFYNENDGPSIKMDGGDTESYILGCDDKCRAGDPNSVEEGSHLLRNALESICMDYLQSKGISFTKIKKTQKDGLSNLFALAETHGLPSTETSKLKSLLDTSNPNSHAWSVANTAPANLRVGIGYIKDIQNNYISK